MFGKSLDDILNFFEEEVKKGTPITPGIWLDGAVRLVSLLAGLDDEMIEAEMEYRQLRSLYIEEGKSAAEAEARAKSNQLYAKYLKLKAKRERVQEIVNLSKKRASLMNWEQ